MTEPEHVNFLIIGAGPTGVGAASRCEQLGLSWLMVEKGLWPGGAAGSVHDNYGFTWDMGGHVLHSHFEAFDKAIADADIEFTYPVRNGWIQTNGRFLPTPIQRQLTELPTDLNPDGHAENLNEYYRNQFGAKLAEEFFIPFQEKMWATDTTQIGHDWTSLRNGSSERNVPELALAGNDQPSSERFPYPKQGTGALWDAIMHRLDPAGEHTAYGTSVIEIDAVAKLATFDTGRVIHYGHIISTMPLPYLCDMVGLSGHENLRANEVFVVGIGFDGEPPAFLADKSWVYNPDPDVWWQRATMLSNYSQDNAGEGRWNILFEVGHSEDFKPLHQMQALNSIWASLEAMGVDRNTWVTTWTRHLKMGYPVPTIGRDETLLEIDDRLITLDIRSRGRFGGWRYESCNQDYSFQQGYDAVDAFMFDLPELAYWKPELFS